MGRKTTVWIFQGRNKRNLTRENFDMVEKEGSLKKETEFHLIISVRRLDIVIVNKKKKRTCRIADFAVPVDHRVKLIENEKKDKYIDLARELKNQ